MRGQLHGSFGSFDDCLKELRQDAWSWGQDLILSGPDRAKIRTYAAFFMEYSIGKDHGREISAGLLRLERGVMAMAKKVAYSSPTRPNAEVDKREFDELIRPLLEAIEAEYRD